MIYLNITVFSMGSTNFIKHIKYNFKRNVVIILLLTVVNSKSDKEIVDTDMAKISCDERTDFKKNIVDWWNKMKDTECIKCKINKHIASNKIFDVSKFIKVPEISTSPCNKNTVFRPFTFTRQIIDNELFGQGKLDFINPKEWKKLSKEKRNKINEQKVCFTVSQDQQLNPIEELIGTFKNRRLNGRSKVKYKDNSFSIAGYRHGKLYGFYKRFNSNQDLLSVGIYENGLEVGYHWFKKFDHLVYENRNVISHRIKPTVVFPILDDGSLADPILGNYYPHPGVIENIYQIEITGVKTNISNCLLDLDYKLMKRLDFNYDLRSKKKVPLVNKTSTLRKLCDIHRSQLNFSSSYGSSNLKGWVDFINDQINAKNQPPKGHELLWRLRPMEQLLDMKTSLKLISDFEFNSKSWKCYARILGSQPLKVHFQYKRIKLDNDLKPNGYNDIQIEFSQRHLIPKDKTLNWAPSRIIGIFHHGVLNGPALVQTNTSSYAWVTVQDGALHGPCIISKTHFTLDIVSTTQYGLIDRYKFC